MLITLWISIGVPAIGMTDSPIWAPPDLARLIEEGLAQNKEIKSLEDRVESLKKEIPFAGSLDDPRLGFAILKVPLVREIRPQDPAGCVKSRSPAGHSGGQAAGACP